MTRLTAADVQAWDERVYGVLRSTAHAGDPCPTNAALAERFGCSPERVRQALERLHTANRIVVAVTGPRRTVMFPDLNGATAPSASRRGAPYRTGPIPPATSCLWLTRDWHYSPAEPDPPYCGGAIEPGSSVPYCAKHRACATQRRRAG